MKQNNLLIVAVLLIVGVFLAGCTTQSTQSEMKKESNTMASENYQSYTPEAVASADGNIVLFFHASWCPSCRGLNSDIEKNIENIPSDVTILKVDYDKETALKQKYGVTTQHTLVQVDNQGNLIKKWSGGSSLEKLISEVQ